MKVLVIGKGGREHALLLAAQSEPDRVGALLRGRQSRHQSAREAGRPSRRTISPGWPHFAAQEKIDLTIVGPEDPLATGIVDEFERAGLTIFGPIAAAAQLEASKAFAKAVMREAGVPTADFEIFDDAEAARRLRQVAQAARGGQGRRTRARQGRDGLRRTRTQRWRRSTMRWSGGVSARPARAS